MANFNLTPPLQEFGAGDRDALALAQFAGRVLTKFPELSVAYRHGLKHQMPSGDSFQFPATWDMATESHVPGTELVGRREPLNEDRRVVIDDEELVAHATLSKRDDLISHLHLIPQWADQAAQGLRNMYDSYWLRCVIFGAREAIRGGVFPAGQRVARVAATIAAAYPVSLAGSQALQMDIGELGQGMDNDDVPKDARFIFLSPYLKRVLLQDRTLTSRDWTDVNTLVTRQLTQVEGFMVEETNHLPRADVAAGEAQYQGLFATRPDLTVCCAIGHDTAVGSVFLEDIDAFGPSWYENRRSWLLGAAMFQGTGWLRPEACGEIHLTA